MTGAKLYLAAWSLAPKIPARLGYALANRGADVAWLHQRLRPSKRGVGQLEANLHTLTGNSDVRGLSRKGMRSYIRYFYEAFALAGVQPEQLRHRVRVEGDFKALKADVAKANVVFALSHSGNWDLAGAWASQELATVLTVAEKVEPPQLFEKFIEFRQGLGMEIIAQAPGQKVFEQLAQKAQQGHYFIPLLADRDLSAAGIEVDFGGQPARVAAGPAVLAARTHSPLWMGAISYERLEGQRRRLAGSSWGIVIHVRKVADQVSNDRGDIFDKTQAWASQMAQLLARYPQDWHMLQAIYTKDLDLERLARSHARQREES